ncbi:MAG: 3'-5' exonuclease domain-containing protein 2 [Odoribacter splanchnicus]|nr:3'-5' exonuclease domain-containing protein 2 [Odoribacter splanchnicus]MBD9180201.1 3'-5' exonuclease domain-containing protein 2 [Odoribacter splanchnicus]
MLAEYKKTIDKEEIKLYPPFIFSGEVSVINDPQQVSQAVNDLSRHRALGFDTETKPSFRKGEVNQVSLLQLATEERVYLFRLKLCGFQPSLRNLLADPDITKIGVGIRDDLRFLRRLGDFTPASFIDLQNYVSEFGIEEKSFSKLMAIIFNVKISKRQRTSNWEAPQFSEGQVRYAATDAWGALKMYQRLSEVAGNIG